MVEFHEDVLCHILCRLPVKSILRCRCVSKQWCNLTSSKSFIKKHINNSKLTKTNQTLVLYQHHLYNIHSIYSIGLYNLYSRTDRAQELAFPVKSSHTITKFIGSCNGLLCFCVHENPGEFIMIWNPTTRKNVKLPDVVVKNPFTQDGIFSPENVDLIHGFGYDSETDDYRVVLFVQFYKDGYNGRSFESEAYVYSLRSNTWRKVQNFPNHLVCIKQLKSVLERGALHWFIFKEKEREFECRVASFDLATEECSVFTQPHFKGLGYMILILSELEGCLSIIWSDFEVGVVHVWVMKEYGVAESWTKLLSVSSKTIRPSEHFSNFMPLAYSESSDEVLLMIDFEKLYWYNLEKKTVKVIDVDDCGFPKPFNAVSCLESLVSLGERAENDEKRGGKNKRAKAKLEKKELEKTIDIGMHCNFFLKASSWYSKHVTLVR